MKPCHNVYQFVCTVIRIVKLENADAPGRDSNLRYREAPTHWPAIVVPLVPWVPLGQRPTDVVQLFLLI
jgi:hypothetical protein